MGGLVCRCYLQNRDIPDLEGKKSRDWTKKGVDKLFTYATPHGGIEFRKGFGSSLCCQGKVVSGVGEKNPV